MCKPKTTKFISMVEAPPLFRETMCKPKTMEFISMVEAPPLFFMIQVLQCSPLE
jgi:hypothetical protein